jgi:hypothetical protein
MGRHYLKISLACKHNYARKTRSSTGITSSKRDTLLAHHISSGKKTSLTNRLCVNSPYYQLRQFADTKKVIVYDVPLGLVLLLFGRC